MVELSILSAEVEQIQKTILEELLPSGCTVEYRSDCEDHYEPENSIVVLSKDYEEFNKYKYGGYAPIRTLLHEICHHLTWSSAVQEPFLAEYLAEKLLRDICRKRDWGKLLEVSDRVILEELRLSKYDPPGHNDYWGRVYMAIRIIEEESIGVLEDKNVSDAACTD